MKNDAFDRRAFLKSAVAGSAAAVTVTLPQPAQAQQQGTPAPASPQPSRLRVPQFRRSGFRRSARRPHGAGRRAHAQGHRSRPQHLHRSRARRRLGQRRAALHAGPVEAGRAEPGLSASAHARASSIAPASRPPMRTASRPTARRSTRSPRASARNFSWALQAGKVTFENGPPARVFFGDASIRTSWKACSRTRCTAATATRRAGR